MENVKSRLERVSVRLRDGEGNKNESIRILFWNAVDHRWGDVYGYILHTV